jgi:hypothetical protein
VVVDEISFLNSDNWRDLNKLALCPEVRFILVGDWRQFRCVGSWSGTAEDSDCVRDLAGHNLLILETNHRSDPALFNFCKGVLRISLDDAIFAARKEFKAKGEARYNLCLSHKSRVAINARVNARHPQGALFVPAFEVHERFMNKPQDMHIWPGLELIGCCAKQGKLFNGGWYTILSIDGVEVKLSSKAGEIVLSPEQVSRDMRLSHAMTYHSSQGTTLEGLVRLHDCDHPRYTLTHLYVGISRATSAALVDVV